ncbi:MAG: helix-turn-helix domain-containing protein [Bacillota bacterium]|nr:helix-turn-helix domain-containing protein [Bacillota bacterium]
MENNTWKTLKKFNFTSYEAKAYLGLLKKNPLTGYELSKISGVPQSKIYETLTRLEKEKIITKLETEPTTFIPMPYTEIINRFKSDFSKNIEELKESFEEEIKSDSIGYVWNINNYDSLIEKCIEICRKSTKDIYIACWKEEYEILKEELANASDKGVNIMMIGYGIDKFEDGVLIHHGVNEYVISRHINREVIIVADDYFLVLGHCGDLETSGIWTFDNKMIFTAKQYIAHDVYLWKITEEFPEIFEKFGNNLEKLHDLIGI